MSLSSDLINSQPGLGDPIVEVLTPRLTSYRYLNNQIVSFLITGISMDGTDTFYDNLIAYFDQQRQADQKVFFLIEIRANVTFTPYHRTRTEDFANRFTEAVGYGAFIFDGGMLLQIIKNFVMILLARRWKHTTFREFKERDKALHWLYERWLADQDK